MTDLPQWAKDRLKQHFIAQLKAKLDAFHEEIIPQLVGRDRAAIKSMLTTGYRQIHEEIQRESKQPGFFDQFLTREEPPPE